MQFKLNTSNPYKHLEFQEIFSKYGHSLDVTTVDIEEINATPLEVLVHKASQLDEDVLVEDTSLDVEGESVGIHVKWLLKHLMHYIGHKVVWTVLLGYRKDDQVYVFKSQIKGEIVFPRGGNGFGFDPIFQPEGCTKTLAESKSETNNARFIAVKAFLNNEPFTTHPLIKEWKGEWQQPRKG